ncbi:hypothetical protein [Microvirga sp. BSC39]|uniref:hypothetical protein n=1 Tax=Microvirga sp. BSC39 TaxID=1549810 RepID=UPI0004E89455|nr:hypothetical protein [Microvirga sp. BSC39]KFG71041.1 hypothetical protein JH26_00400 [Microvirga sp. BSC39]
MTLSNPENDRLPPACLERLERLKHCRVTDVHFIKSTLAGVLEDLCEPTGDRDFARAGRDLYQQPAGRPAVDDSKAIEEALFLFEQGEAPTLNNAFMRVAGRLVGYSDRRRMRSTAERLRKKYAQMQKAST